MRPRLLLLVPLCALAVHAAAVGGGFVYDDRPAVLENPVVQGPWNAGQLLRRDYWGRPAGAAAPATWRPLAVATLWCDWRLGGGSPLPFHLVNAVLHALSSLALSWALLVHTRRPGLALAAGLIYAALGASSEAVAGIVGRADVLAAGLGWLAWAAAGPAGATSGRRALASAVATLAAMLCKESAVVIPLMLVAADRILSAPPPRLWSARYLAVALAVASAVALRLLFFGDPLQVWRSANNNPLLGEPLAVRLLTAPRLFLLALRILALPLNLSADYSFAEILPERSLLSADVLVGLGALALLAATWILARRRRPAAALGAALLIVGWLPASNIAFALPAIFAERLLYLPAAGVALLWAELAAWLGERVGPRAQVAVLALVVGGNGALAARADGAWRDDLSLFSQAVEVSTRSARAWLNYATALDRAGRTAESLAAVERGLAIAPAWAALQAQAGALLDRAGRSDEAAAALGRAVQLDPHDARSAYNLALFLARHGDRPGARAAASRFIADNPGRLPEGAPLLRLAADLARQP